MLILATNDVPKKVKKVLLAQEIINNVWAIHPKLAIGYLQTVGVILRGEKESLSDLKEIKKQNEEQNAMRLAIPQANGKYKITRGPASEAPEGSIAIISYSGIVRMKTGMSQKGTEETRKELEDAGQSGNIRAVLFKLHTGGGSIFGTESLANDVKEFESKYSKPIAVLVEDQ